MSTFISSFLLLGWRTFKSGPTLQGRFAFYLAGMTASSLLMLGAGYSGGEMLLGAENGAVGELLPSKSFISAPDQPALMTAGEKLFLQNCAHCHGADARGDEGPDLHNLDWTDKQIAMRIRTGKKGQMPSFTGKILENDVFELIRYLRTLK